MSAPTTTNPVVDAVLAGARRGDFSLHLPHRPAVSVVCVTARRRFLRDLWVNYQRQEYAERSLVVVVNGPRELADVAQATMGAVPRVQILYAPDMTVGACRNLGVETANGDIVAMFDDDDLYGPHYLSEAVALLVHTGADLVGKLSYLWIDGRLGVFRYCRPPGPWSIAIPTLSGNTQVFRRKAHCPASGRVYANQSLAEDYHFSMAIAHDGGLLLSSGPDHFVRRRNLDAEHHHLWDGTAPGFDLTAHQRLCVTWHEAEVLARIHCVEQV